MLNVSDQPVYDHIQYNIGSQWINAVFTKSIGSASFDILDLINETYYEIRARLLNAQLIPIQEYDPVRGSPAGAPSGPAFGTDPLDSAIRISNIAFPQNVLVDRLQYSMDGVYWIDMHLTVEFTISNLINEAPYNISLRGVNRGVVGTSTTIEQRPAKAPSKPQILTVEPESNSVVFEYSFEPGTVLTGVQYEIDDSDTWHNIVHDVASGKFELHPEHQNVQYAIRIRGENRTVFGTPSLPSRFWIGGTPHVNVIAGDQSLTIEATFPHVY